MLKGQAWKILHYIWVDVTKLTYFEHLDSILSLTAIVKISIFTAFHQQMLLSWQLYIQIHQVEFQIDIVQLDL